MAALSTSMTFEMRMLRHSDMSLHKTFEIQNLGIEIADPLLTQIRAVGFAHSQIDLFPFEYGDFWILRFTKKESAFPDKVWTKELFDKLSKLIPSEETSLKACLIKTKSDHKDDK